MINSKVNNSGLGSGGSGVPTYKMHSPVAIRKTALRDVQNGNRGLNCNHSENSYAVEGRSSADTIKFSGTKRVAPECPSSNQSLRRCGANEHLMYAGEKFESEQGRRKIQDNRDISNVDSLQLRQFNEKQQDIPKQRNQMREPNTCSVPIFAPKPMASLTTSKSGGSSVPGSLKKHGKGMTASESVHAKITSEVPHAIDYQGILQQRKQRFLQLQQLLKHFDESNQSEYIQKMSHMSPTELSREAVELEKRSIQLTVEEGKEIKRMKELNILGRSS